MEDSFHNEPKIEVQVVSEEIILDEKGCNSSNITSSPTTLLNKEVTTKYTQHESKTDSSSHISTTLNENIGGKYFVKCLNLKSIDLVLLR